MKKILLLAITAFFLVSNAFAEKQIHKYQFGQPTIIQKGNYQEIVYDNCQNLGEEGNPLIPMFNANLLVPQGEIIVAVNILEMVFYPETHSLTLLPASKPFPISKPAKNYTVEPNRAIYLSDAAYPAKQIDHVTTGFLSGHGIGSFTICPVSWIPAEKTTTFLKSITVEVITEQDKDAAKATTLLKTNRTIRQRIQNIVDNSEALEQYHYPASKEENETDLLIITNEALQPGFEEFIQFKTSLGYYTEIITVETLYATWPGADNQEKIRNCIIDYYTLYNTKFVILGGDSDPANSADYILPHRGFFSQDELDIPSDMYYSCLDGTWNDDEDNKWGESGETDLFAEVLIGRFCVDNLNEIYNLTQKNILYQTQPVVEDIEKALMLGEQLDDNPTYGGNYKDEIVTGSSNNGYTTQGIAENITINTLYDRDMSWEKTAIFNQFNTVGINLMNHLGHSNTNYNMKMYCSDVTLQNFTNDGITRGFVIGYSQGCYNGSFDNRGTSPGSYDSQDSFAEYITNLARAEVACISNSRYGWYMPSSTNSSSQMYDREFFDALFGENISMIGAMNADSKEDNPGVFNANENYRWVAYESNLFGDPTLDVWTEQPQDITAYFPPSVIIGLQELELGTEIPFARVALLQNNMLIGRGVADEYGQVVITLNEILSSTDPITLSVIAHNYNRLLHEMVVVSNQPYVVCTQHTINDELGNGNGQADYAETIQLGLTLTNIGDQPSGNVSATLTCEDNYISITNGSGTFGEFEAGESITMEDIFAFTVADSIPDGHSVTLNVTASDASQEWNSKIRFTIHAPIIRLLSAQISDPEGNNNGYPDPGETVDILFTIGNEGHADCYDLETFFSCVSEYVTINFGNSGTINQIAAQESSVWIVNVTFSPLTPMGTMAGFEGMIDAGPYSISDVLVFKIGMIVESFETGDFSAYEWLLAGNAPWNVVTDNVYDGTYAARSGAINNNQLSIMQIENYDVAQNDSIAFMVKISSEPGYDYLYFYMGDLQLGEWEGEKDWQRVAFAIPAGVHTFRWLYKKDQYVAGGNDCAWVDFIELPAPDMGVGIQETHAELSLQIMPNPASDIITLRVENPVSQNISVQLKSLDGKYHTVIVNNEPVEKGVHTFTSDITHLPEGVYMLMMTNERTRITKKVIINK
ncbi:MAG: C25 family cysteine peptidase [Bacteroidales bacterium]|nr:C25 family cysteine peptidase [Bacteroidales bacterium]MDD2323246.1 C25 family cysteine peptidase [Bacteroidales bacterium]MDY0285742.1 C25 family cysteine peptidase [Bacteroidales bacterium]HPE87293.1 C25 family cysteine peptidase [Bacteroidales bacterium]